MAESPPAQWRPRRRSSRRTAPQLRRISSIHLPPTIARLARGAGARQQAVAPRARMLQVHDQPTRIEDTLGFEALLEASMQARYGWRERMKAALARRRRPAPP